MRLPRSLRALHLSDLAALGLLVSGVVTGSSSVVAVGVVFAGVSATLRGREGTAEE